MPNTQKAIDGCAHFRSPRVSVRISICQSLHCSTIRVPYLLEVGFTSSNSLKQKVSLATSAFGINPDKFYTSWDRVF